MTDRIEQFWRDATAEDVARVMKGEKVEARFWDYEQDPYLVYLFLGGYDASHLSGLFWIANNGSQWKCCQVYDPPQWYIDKPDPGEGWRLLEKFPDEPKLATDEAWNWDDAKWQSIARDGEQEYATWYRRRIEPVKQDAGSTCASTIPKGWTALLLDEPRLASDAYWSLGAKDWIIIGDARLEWANGEKWPAIRQVETHKSLQLVAGYRYRLPSGVSIIATKHGFEVF